MFKSYFFGFELFVFDKGFLFVGLNVLGQSVGLSSEKTRGNNVGRGSVVRASEFKSEDPGFDPLAGLGMIRDMFSVSPSQLLCKDLFVPDPTSCVRHATGVCAR